MNEARLFFSSYCFVLLSPVSILYPALNIRVWEQHFDCAQRTYITKREGVKLINLKLKLNFESLVSEVD